MAYTYEQVFAADPANPSNIAQNAAITIFAPGDVTMTPLTITDPDGQPLANPIPVNANGFGSAFAHATLDRVAWAGGGFTGFFTSYEGMKQVAVDAQAAAEAAAATAGADAAAVATAAIGDATDDAAAAAASAATAASNASASATAAANSAALVGAPADAAVETLINSASATKAALNATFARVVTSITGESPTATLVRLNAALAAAPAFGTRKTVVLVGDFVVNGPVVAYSDTEIDARSATVSFSTGTTGNLLTNRSAVTPQRTVADAAITNGSTTVTSATAAFTSADVGRSLYINGATPKGFVLCATITAVTNGTTVTISKAAGATVSGATATLYDRDHDITVRGGKWNRGTGDGPAGNAKHTVLFRRVDKLTFQNMEITTGGGKYALFPADVTQLRVLDISLNTASDGIHLQGPIRGAIVRGISGNTADDTVALGNTDVSFQDTFGDMLDVLVDGVTATSTNPTVLVKIYGAAAPGGTDGAPDAAAGSIFRNVTIRNIIGKSGGPLVTVSTDAIIDDMTIDGVSGEAVGALVRLLCANAGTIELSRLRATAMTDPSSGGPRLVETSSVAAVAITNLILRDSSHKSALTDATLLYVAPLTTIAKLRVSGCTLDAPTATSPKGLVHVSGIITRAEVQASTASVGASAAFFFLAANANVNTLVLVGNEHTSATVGSGSFVSARTSPVTLGKVYYYGNVVTNCDAGLADLAGATELHVYGHTCTGAGLRLRATGNATLLGDGTLDAAATMPLTSAGYAFRVNHRGAKVDLSLVTSQQAGDRAYNTNAAVAPAVGPVTSNGTAWQNAITGAIKTGVLTLVGGTVTAANTSITANSVIRVANRSVGGTPGALFVSARAAGTSFTITSTNAADTSSVQYDVISY